MHNNSLRTRVSAAGSDDLRMFGSQRSKLISLMLRTCRRQPANAFGCAVMFALIATVVGNALFAQEGPHPAPMLRAVGIPNIGGKVNEPTGSVLAVPRPRPTEVPAPAKEQAMGTRTRAQLMNDLQRELARRGFYEGPVDGIYGPKMDAAIRDFEQSAGLRSAGEPGEALLQSVTASPVKGPAKSLPVQAVRRTEVAPAVPSSPRVIAVQRALSEFGYGQIKLTGIYDEATKAAVEKFERERKLPVSGQITDRLMRELAAVTGRPLE